MMIEAFMWLYATHAAVISRRFFRLNVQTLGLVKTELHTLKLFQSDVFHQVC